MGNLESFPSSNESSHIAHQNHSSGHIIQDHSSTRQSEIIQNEFHLLDKLLSIILEEENIQEDEKKSLENIKLDSLSESESSISENFDEFDEQEEKKFSKSTLENDDPLMEPNSRNLVQGSNQKFAFVSKDPPFHIFGEEFPCYKTPEKIKNLEENQSWKYQLGFQENSISPEKKRHEKYDINEFQNGSKRIQTEPFHSQSVVRALNFSPQQAADIFSTQGKPNNRKYDSHQRSCLYIALLKDNHFYVGWIKKGIAMVPKMLAKDHKYQPQYCKKFPFVKIIYKDDSQKDDTKLLNLTICLMNLVGVKRVNENYVHKILETHPSKEGFAKIKNRVEGFSDYILKNKVEDALKAMKLDNLNDLISIKDRYIQYDNSCSYCKSKDKCRYNCMSKEADQKILDNLRDYSKNFTYESWTDIYKFKSMWRIRGQVYVLLLKDNYFYVGHTRGNIDKRFMDHLGDYRSSRMCKLKEPKEILFHMEGDLLDEDLLTLTLMRKFGWWRVRGGRWCRILNEVPEPLLNPFSLRSIKSEPEFLSQFNFPFEEDLEKLCDREACKDVWKHHKFACPKSCPLSPYYGFQMKFCRYCGSSNHPYSTCPKKTFTLFELAMKIEDIEKAINKEYIYNELKFISPVYLGLEPYDLKSWLKYLLKYYKEKETNPGKDMNLSYIPYELRLTTPLDLKSVNFLR